MNALKTILGGGDASTRAVRSVLYAVLVFLLLQQGGDPADYNLDLNEIVTVLLGAFAGGISSSKPEGSTKP